MQSYKLKNTVKTTFKIVISHPYGIYWARQFKNTWHYWGAVLRWWRNRTGRSLSPPQIHQKINWTLSKFHKFAQFAQFFSNFTSWENFTKQLLNAGSGHQGPRKAAHSLWREEGQNIKDKKRGKRVRDGDPSCGGSREGGKVSKHQETLSPAGLWGVLASQRTT